MATPGRVLREKSGERLIHLPEDALPQAHRLTNAFSKKLENFRAAVAMNFAYDTSARFTAACPLLPRRQPASSPANGLSPNLSKAVANKEYIERLQMVIRQLHTCDAEHIGMQPVKEVFQGQTVWDGEVEVFTVNHPRAKRAYAWSQGQGTPQEKFTAVLEIPPVKSALDAVEVAIVAEMKKAEAK